MATICFYFQVHQPYRLGNYRVFDIGTDRDYFDAGLNDRVNNELILKKVARTCYVPANALMLELLNHHPEFKVSYSISGVALEQFASWAPEVLLGFQKLAQTGRVEFLSETYHHSLSFLYSQDEFFDQIQLHRDAILKHFGVVPTTFRNTELVYSNDIARMVRSLGYTAILAEGADHVLEWRSPNVVYSPKGIPDMKLLLKNYKLSDDIAFRFSSKEWEEWPLTASKYAQWIGAQSAHAQTINLFMDYETFGEHQWEDTGIFSFLRALPCELLKNKHLSFATPCEVAQLHDPVAELDMPHYVSWADVERDLSAWRDNEMQYDALRQIYELEGAIKLSGDVRLLEDWRRLTTSDHFYYMCTKWFADGDVHAYFNPYETPYEAFIFFMNALTDIRSRIVACNAQVAQKIY
ncbi:MAG: glycoside hydrolase family 57 protein [bacterium]|nr:glycoside hydrolase family 57 protein [bacterium]